MIDLRMLLLPIEQSCTVHSSPSVIINVPLHTNRRRRRLSDMKSGSGRRHWKLDGFNKIYQNAL